MGAWGYRNIYSNKEEKYYGNRNICARKRQNVSIRASNYTYELKW